MPPNTGSELEVSNDNVHVLEYNIDWMASTFRSRATAIALLSPERESGNLTTRDYDSAVRFLPGAHHYYPTIGFAAGAVLAMVLRHRYPRMSTGKKVFIFFGTTCAGVSVGRMKQLNSHVGYMCGIENPDGYKRAMENVQKGPGRLPTRKGPFIRRVYELSPDDTSPQPTLEHVGILSESSLSVHSSSAERSQSKWDQIRAANSRTAQNSVWDALRQQHEKVRVNPKPQDRDGDKWNTSDG